MRENLQAHPRIWMPMVGELHYFDEPLKKSNFQLRLASERAKDEKWRHAALAKLQRLAMADDVSGAAWWATFCFLDHNDHWYRSLFAFAPPESMTGDVTPSYMLCGADEIAHMHRVAPQAKLLLLLRHPVERFWSQCKMKIASGSLAPGEPAAMRFLDTDIGRPRGIYSQAILRFCEKFSPEQILLVFHEGIRREPVTVMQSIFQFLNLPPAPLIAADLEKPVNQAASREAMPSGLKARVEAAYRSELEVLADVFGGHAAGWLDGGKIDDASPPVVRLTAEQVHRLKSGLRHRGCQRSGKGKVFCLSMQRSGTTSVGDWLESHGLARAGTPTSLRMGWTRLWMQGDYEAIFSSPEFCDAEVFDDDPWWCPDLFQVVAERFPDAKFILLERDAETWFDSMCHHSGGRNPGWTDVHARIYQREADLQEVMRREPAARKDAGRMLSIVEHREHYQSIYRRHIQAVREYFSNQPDRLFYGRLEDPAVFAAMCIFVGARQNPAIAVPHTNARTDDMRQAFAKHLATKGQ